MGRHTSAGHLSIDIGHSRATDVPFLFGRRPQRVSLAVALSVALDILIVVLLVYASRSHQPQAIPPSDQVTRHLVFLREPGPGGGGGGGGNRVKEPPRRAESPGRDAITVPVLRPPALEPPSAVNKEPDPVAHLNIPVQDMASALQSIRGAIDAPAAPPSNSQGPGDHGGSGTGRGPGDGPGQGPGLGPGRDGGVGDGIFQLGNGVTSPTLVREVKPAYTSDAMRARLQGSVFLSCVVRPDGSVSEVKVLKSLDQTFGLDLEAIKAARQWRFRPGTRLGNPVPVLITIQLDFALR